MTATAPAPARLEELPPLRGVSRFSEPSLPNIAAQFGCDTAAIVELIPFFVDDALITVLASTARSLRSAELLTCLEAVVVRRPKAEQILLGVRLDMARHTVYMDETLFEHERLILCVEPPLGYAASAPDTIRAELGAHVISLAQPELMQVLIAEHTSL